MNLHQCYLTKNACYIQGTKITPKGVVVHSTGANNPRLKRYVQPNDGLLGANTAGNHWNQAYPGGKSVCVHAFIGKLENGSIATYQTLPFNYKGWHVGAGSKGSANNTHIGFEICEDGLNDKTYFDAVYKEAVEFCAYICKLYNFDPLADGVVICHSEAYSRGIGSNHADVMHWFPKFGKNMNTFRADVAALMKEEEEEMTQEQFNKMMENYMSEQGKLEPGDWSAEARQFCIDNGIFAGYGNGEYGWKGLLSREQAAQLIYNLHKKGAL